jgi:hypothetical protein
MSLRLPITLLLGASISTYAADNDKTGFQVGPASSYKEKQTISGVTVAAEAYDSHAQAGAAFGKLDPYEYGVLPVLLVIQNDSKQTIKIDRMLAQYITPSREKIEATPASDVPYLKAPKNPAVLKSPIPGLGKPKKSPLLNPVIGERAFAAKMIPPGDSASGFVYFQTGHRNGSKLYLTGLLDAATNAELFYFEIPLESH